MTGSSPQPCIEEPDRLNTSLFGLLEIPLFLVSKVLQRNKCDHEHRSHNVESIERVGRIDREHDRETEAADQERLVKRDEGQIENEPRDGVRKNRVFSQLGPSVVFLAFPWRPCVATLPREVISKSHGPNAHYSAHKHLALIHTALVGSDPCIQCRH